MAIQIVEIPNHQNKVRLRVAHGHFATSHSHINYYIDLTMTKHRLSEARIAAEELCRMYKNSTIVDSILCLDGTEVLGTCMASALSEAGFRSMNAHQTIYVVTPEHTLRKPADLPGQYRSDDCGQACAGAGSLPDHRLYRPLRHRGYPVLQRCARWRLSHLLRD